MTLRPRLDEELEDTLTLALRLTLRPRPGERFKETSALALRLTLRPRLDESFDKTSTLALRLTLRPRLDERFDKSVCASHFFTFNWASSAERCLELLLRFPRTEDSGVGALLRQEDAPAVYGGSQDIALGRDRDIGLW
eukprot:CAMPEP_0172492254 /NCGR_PEP_ID=MMETSP1066-20121228/23338_1 /TAXON_ID=671091 /ORGANISM="Coscinodiscus wailesii, Strain CCMP2513" /LENGTH=137 /DNA_ID=CAMNT_0013261763 /DNA_START=229 /DNA_END=639 /DNA_ORIENTATION=-